ncbi:CPBP family intramembrane metalloprotease [Clostridium botulinum]|uniref:CAAX amino terminal protease n=2 Tax=Clostridium botulinum TaxID=1491 RepID=A5I0B8_CLOBH|nr:type II CAAX endopeptidase family protein [Clostridium botulinum]ABS32544.1 CAAX amino terminal protease family protein [Clostridium botulinum A str. ATCC 19397]ABS37015.1 CAAX amino terminal protease family protein [Clostridium botulinum A str. Hall]APQ71607.1 CAAX protease self-immunity family protein [Clostridium botulinum]APQ95558.1 CAAX protease self-immunity family protein [Clostridium botulinum]AUM87078.1 CPBP family intramembrane metalloprotease [Clostridium botulinum]
MKNGITTFKAISAIFGGIFVLVICQSLSHLAYILPLPKVITSMVFGITYILLSYLFLSNLCKKFFCHSLLECGIGKPKINFTWLVIGIILPIMVSVLLILTPGYFVNNGKSTTEIISKIIISIFTVGCAAVVEEMIFRGFIMYILKQRWGKMISIFVPSIVFGLLHTMGGMNFSDILMLFIAGTSVGIMFSLITYESKTIWPSAIVHAIWNIIIIGGILDIGVKHNAECIYSYVLNSKSILLTGGHFGIEASVISIIGYIAVISFTMFRVYKKKDIAIDI